MAKKLAEFRPVSLPFAFMPFDMGFFQRFLNLLLLPNLKFGNHIFDLSHFACPWRGNRKTWQ
ncbi:MAG: hypothetical protein HFF69_11865 [Oscillospiraceae bacterium]|jgi:hypothetical protein|nr:hypothetical protein [Oscillospiraceae bacterium]